MTNTHILTRFAVVTGITMAALIAVNFVLNAYFAYDAGAGLGLVSMIVPAMDAGANHVRKTSHLIEKPRMWRLAAFFALINVGMGMAWMTGLVAAYDVNLASIYIQQIGFGVVLGIMVFFIGLYLLAGRFFLGLAARQELKRQEKQRR